MGYPRIRVRRSGTFLVVQVVVMLWAASVLAQEIARVGAPRAIWVWEEDTFEAIDQVSARNEMLAFLARHRITTVYLYADELGGRNILVDEPAKYRSFIAAAHDHGILVYALLGSAYLKTPEYILPEKRSVAERMFRRVLVYNAGGESSSRFDGVNIDIEPYLLDDWNAQKPLRIQQYLDLSAAFMRMKAEAGSSILVGPAMPFWFDGIEDVVWNGKRQRLSDHIQDIHDYVAIMDYRNFAEGGDGLISHALDELVRADHTGRKVLIGVETLKTTPEKVTFFGKGPSYMEGQMSLAEAAFAKHPSFAGFVIHHMGSYRALVREAPPAR